MFFLGYNFLGADEMAIPISPVIPTEDNVVEVFNVMADALAITENTTDELTADVNMKWDFDTVLIADFNHDTLAGNVKWALDALSHVAIKRRIVGDYKWMTIAIKEITDTNDLNISGTDITCESLEYEYAVTPILNGIDGEYSGVIVDVTNEDLTLIDATGIYHTPLTDGFCDVTDVHPNSVLELLHHTYPAIVRNTIANYETIQVSGIFLPYDLCQDNFNEVFENDRLRVLYNREIKRFITNGRTKILKNVDGQCWLVYVTTPPTDTADQVYNVRKLTFGCTETGDLKKEADLYYAGLLDVPEEFWSSSS